jgi:hypothetical protein
VENPTYPGPIDGVLVRLPDDTHEYVEAGQKLKAKVPAGFVKQLVAQGWTPGATKTTKPKVAKKPAAAKTSAAAPASPQPAPAAGTTEGDQ